MKRESLPNEGTRKIPGGWGTPKKTEINNLPDKNLKQQS